MHGSMTAMRIVAVLAYENARLFDLAVALEVWGVDRTDAGVPAFEVRICTQGRRAVRSDRGPVVKPTHGLQGLKGADLVLVVGLENLGDPLPEPLLDALRRSHLAGTPVAALCSGAVVLARAGLLDGHRATTHWLHTDYLARTFPTVDVETDRLFLEDGGCWTSAGVTAAIDLCLHLVRLAHGADVAGTIARHLVTPPHREGSQRQFVERPLEKAVTDEDLLTATMQWARGCIANQITVKDLARHNGVSPRTFARRFTDSTGTTPMAWLTHERLQLAQRLLERTELPIAAVAHQAGLGSPLTMRRHFKRQLDTTPSIYRRAFRLFTVVDTHSSTGRKNSTQKSTASAT